MTTLNTDVAPQRKYFIGFEPVEAAHYDGTHKSAIDLCEFMPSLFDSDVELIQFGERMPTTLTRLTDAKGGQWVVTMLGGGVRNWHGNQEYDTPWSRLPEDLFPMRTGGTPFLFSRPVPVGSWVVKKTASRHVGIETTEPAYVDEWLLGKMEDSGEIRRVAPTKIIPLSALFPTHRQALLSNGWTTPWELIEKENAVR